MNNQEQTQPAMPTLLDCFAMAALTGLLASESCPNESMGSSYISYSAEQAARISYNVAEEMMKERRSRMMNNIDSLASQQNQQ